MTTSTRVSGARLWPRLAWFLATTLATGGCDLGTKQWAESALAAAPNHSIMVAAPWLEFSLAYNRGTAFSLVRDLGDARLVLGLVAIALVALLLAMALRADTDRIDLVAFASIAGGALGNGIDRAFRFAPGGSTGVVDFVKINFPWGGSWPAFNAADALIALGIGVLLVRHFLRRGPADASVAAAG